MTTTYPAEAISESELLSAVVDLAHTLGYLVTHFRPAKTDKGWRTAVSADGAGFVDLVLVGRGRVIFAELKSATGKLSHAQREWGIALRGAGARYCLWTPEDWLAGRIEKVLR